VETRRFTQSSIRQRLGGPGGPFLAVRSGRSGRAWLARVAPKGAQRSLREIAAALAQPPSDGHAHMLSRQPGTQASLLAVSCGITQRGIIASIASMLVPARPVSTVMRA
jgi:hypothetical protein